MREEARRAAEETHMSVLELFRSKEVRWQLISICLMMLSQQLSGKLSKVTAELESLPLQYRHQCRFLLYKHHFRVSWF